MKLRYFSIEEAESLLPQITEIFNAGQETKFLIEQKVDSWRKVHKKIKVAEEAVLRGQVDFLASRLEEQLGAISELGCVPKDLDLGLVDFPARMNGKEGYLCWKVGEDRVQFWHGLTEGYTGRKRITKEDKVS
jgi:hypothetical protein